MHWYRGAWGDVYHETPRITRQGPPKGIVTRRDQPSRVHGTHGPSTYVDDGKRLLRSVIYSPSMHGSGLNETEKPVGLVEHLVTYGCPPDGMVLDIFAGACTTLMAARNSGRRAVGIELREEQCATAVKWRLSQCVLPLHEHTGLTVDPDSG